MTVAVAYLDQRMSDEAATMAHATSDGTTTIDLSTASTDTGRTETSNAKQDLNSKNAMFFYHILASMENKPEVGWLFFDSQFGILFLSHLSVARDS